MKVVRKRDIRASPAAIWEIVGDPGRLPEWWPRVERVESVDAGGFTEVYRTAKGKPVRADFRIAALKPEKELRVVQQLEGTPYARIFSEAGKRVSLKATGTGTLVELEFEQTPNSMARFGGVMVKKALTKQLDAGLDALASLVT